MDLLRSRKFRVLVMGVALMLYILNTGDPLYSDWCVPTIGLMVFGYMISVAVEDGLTGQRYA